MPHIPTAPVTSSNIERIGYDPTRQTLRIIFHGGRGYDYEGVDEQTYAALEAADSKGRFVAAMIKPIFGWRRVASRELRCCGHEDPEDCDMHCAPRSEGPCCGPLPEEQAEAEKCAACDGTGITSVVGTDDSVDSITCGWCGGTGREPTEEPS